MSDNNILKQAGEILRAEHIKYIESVKVKYDELHMAEDVNQAPHETILNITKDYLSLSEKMIVDFGCGNGKLGSLIKGAKAYAGIDISKYIVDQLTAKNKTDYSMFITASITDFRLPSKTDIGFCLDTLENIHEMFMQKALLRLSQNVRNCVISINLSDDPQHEIKKDSNWWAKEVSIYFDIEKSVVIDSHLILITKEKSQ